MLLGGRVGLDCLLFNALYMQAPSPGLHHPQIGSNGLILHPTPPTPPGAGACIVSKVPFNGGSKQRSPPPPSQESNNCSNRRRPLTEIKSERSMSSLFSALLLLLPQFLSIGLGLYFPNHVAEPGMIAFQFVNLLKKCIGVSICFKW